MVCPKCGSEHTEVFREERSRDGVSLGSAKATGSGRLGGLASSSQIVTHQTTALCHDCGYSWQIPGEQEEKAKQTAKGCAYLIVIVAALVVALWLFAVFYRW